MEWLRNYLTGLTAAAVVCALAQELCPNGAVKGVLRSLCGAVMAAALIAPLLRLDYPAYALELGRYREEAAALTASAEETQRRADRRVVESELESHVMKLAAETGATLRSVRFRLRWAGEGYWYPEAVSLWGTRSEALEARIEAELGVARSAQTWRTDEDAGSEGMDEGPAAP